MRLSIFTVVDAFSERDAARDRYGEVLAMAEEADRAGLSTLWVAEHHFHAGGVCPSPPVLLASAGARTRRLRLGVLVSPLPFHAPIELAEEYALLDRLIGGRLSLGVGSGFIPLEFEGFGLSPEHKRERFDSHLETMLSALRGEPVRSPGASTAVRINVTPLQRPHPPVRVAVQRRAALPFLARRGLDIALIPYATTSGLSELSDVIGEYRAALPEGVRGDVAAAFHVYAGADATLARRHFQEYLDTRLATQSPNYEARVHADPHLASAGALEAQGFGLFGTPEELRPRLEAVRATGVDELLAILDFGGLPLESVLGSIRGLASLVGPLGAPSAPTAAGSVAAGSRG